MADEVKRKQKRDYTYAVGRRREAVARVRLYGTVKEGLMFGETPVVKGQILVNGNPIEHYFPGPVSKAKYMKPLIVTTTDGKFALTIKVSGGGRNGQLDATVLGIARALSAHSSEKYRKALKVEGLLTRDPRARERRKVGTGGKARRAKQSPKR
ncbi:MAG TPA: 30S ribosomal protein S9, partial [Patescibacteria group bacterium]